jgi:anthranilate phosphoribosyltransferase
MILGVPQRELGIVFASALREAGVKGWVVCGHEGLDEISCAGGTWVWEVPSSQDDEIVERSIHPADFDLPTHHLSIVKGGSPTENANILEELLATPLDRVNPSYLPILDFVLMNAAALLVVSGVAKNPKHGVELARESVTTGKAWDAVLRYREVGVSSIHRFRPHLI